MAESTMEIKHSGPTLDVSVSFGRFQSDSLSWEKWSSFSPNKYLEEVEKCSTPGSVAQKKAYFEAHYKMIAARKASEQVELEKLTGSDTQELGLDLKCPSEAIESFSSATDDCDHSNGKVVENETCQISSPASSQESIHQGESLDILEVPDLLPQELTSINGTMEERKEENTHKSESKIKEDQKTELEKNHETKMEKNHEMKMGKNQEMGKEKKTHKTAVNIKDDFKLDSSKKSQKVRNSAEIKKKSTSPLIRSPQVFTQKIPKQLSTSMVASSSSHYHSSSPMRKTKTPATDSKRIAPSSLHMSMSSERGNSDHLSSSLTRKSLIMEKMGDKDIVKRAFRTFQNSFNQLRSPADEKSTQRKQVLASSSSVTLRKENGSTRKTQPVKTNQTPSQPGSKGTKSAGHELVIGSAVDQRKAKPAPSLGLRSNERSEIHKPGKKLEEKPANNLNNPKMVEGKGRTNEPKTKLNTNKASNNRPNPNQLKSTFKKKSLLEMESTKLEKHRGPESRT